MSSLSELPHDIVTLKKITTPEVCDLCSSMTTTMVINRQHRSVSFPPILYYATIAKHLNTLGFTSDRDAIEHGVDIDGFIKDVFKSHLEQIFPADYGINDMKVVQPGEAIYSEPTNQKNNKTSEKEMQQKEWQSEKFQILLLSHLLDDKAVYNEKAPHGYEHINCSRAKLNLTQPNYLMSRVSSYLGSKKATKLQLHQIACELQSITKNINEKDPIWNESKARKVGNQLFLILFRMSGLLDNYPALMTTQMKRMLTQETRYYSGQLLVRANT